MKSSFIIKTLNNHMVTTHPHTQSAFGLWGRAMMVAITPLKTVARVALNETAPLKHFLAATFFALLFVAQLANAQSLNDFVTTWSTQGSPTIVIPTTGSGYSYNVNWGDGGTDTMDYTGDAMHTYADAGTYTVRISGDFPRIYFNADSGNANSNSIIAINQWGTGQWTSMERAFSGATNLAGQTTTDRPDLSRVTSMEGMFRHAEKFNQDIGDWDVSNVENMGTLFEFAHDFNQDISRWDVSNVTNMTYMFRDATDFNRDISRWDVRGVTDMSHMFDNATAFNQDISRWDVRGVTNMSSIFDNADAFSQNLGAWYITGDLSVSPALEAGAEVTTFTAQNSVLSGHNPSYMLGGADSSAFTLTDGVLTINAAPAAIGTLYDIRISIPVTGTGTVLVGTDNHRDLTFAVNNKPMITSNNGDSQYEITLPENTKAVTTITATDMDANTLTYTLSNNDAALFEINNAGELSFKDEYIPDYEKPRDAQGNIDQNADQEYSVLVSVSDGVSTRTQEIRVTIVELAPSISISTNTLVATVGSAITPITIDSSGGAVALFAINPTLSDGLTLDTATGTISGTPTAIATLTTYTITATNSGGTDTATIAIAVNGGAGEIPAGSLDDFVTTWKIVSSHPTITIPTFPTETYNYTVDWGDNVSDADVHTGGAVHTYADAGDYDIRISGTFPRIYYPSTSSDNGSSTIVAIKQWGAGRQWTSMAGAFRNATNLAGQASDRPDLSQVTDMSEMFQHARAFNQDIGNWDVSNVTNMKNMFRDAGAFNKDIGDWDVSDVTSMEFMFRDAGAFNQDIGGWDVRKVSNMTLMFLSANDFSQNLGAWYVTDAELPSDDPLPETLTFTVGSTAGINAVIGSITAQNNVLNGHAPSYTLVGDGADLFSLIDGSLSVAQALSSPSYTLGITSTGGYGENNSRTLTIINAAITAPIAAPSISISPNTLVATVGTAIADITISSSGGGNVESYSIDPTLPAGLSFSTATGTISGTPTAIATLTTYTITATNSGGTDTATVNITVNEAPTTSVDVPIISINPATVTVTAGTAIQPITISSNGGAVESYSISSTLTTGLSFSTTTGTISGTPTAVASLITYTITAENSVGADTATVAITVNEAPTTLVAVPIISINPATVTVTAGTAIQPITISSNGGAVESYSISSTLTTGLSFSTTTGTISGTPTAIASLITYTITAENSVGSDTATVAITVNEAPTTSVDVPIISINPATVTVTAGTAIQPITISSNGGAVESYSISSTLTTGLSFSTTTGTISGTPTAVASLITYTITAENSVGSDTATVAITVNEAPTTSVDVPIISINPATVTVTAGTAIQPITISSNGGAVESYSIDPTLPAGLSFSTATGTISGTPTAIATLTTYTITATNSGGTDTATVNITVNEAPTTSVDVPIISINPATVTVTAGTAIQPITISSNGGAVESYSISSTLTTGLSFSTTTGTISGTPTAVASLITYTITAENSVGSDTATVAITVNEAPTTSVDVPIISINPATVTVTAGTAIQPITISSNGGAVESYSISSTLTTGLSFSTTTGTISGTPTAVAGPATYTITATNVTGADTATVNITVNATPTAPIITYRGGVANSDGTETATGYSVYVANVNPSSNDIDEDFLQRAEGTSVVDTITATNDGSRSIEYFLPTLPGSVLGDNNLFEIDSSSGVLSFKSPPDYEYPLNSDGTTQGANQIYWAIVQVKISGTNIKSELLLIKVEITNIDLDVSISASSGGTTLTGSTDTHTVALTVDQGAEVTLSSVVHSYDPTEGGVTHTWTQVAGETVALDDASAATVTFRVPDQITETLTLSFLLTVSDDVGSDTVVFVHNTATITVTPAAPSVAVPSISISTNTLVATVGSPIDSITITSSGGAVALFAINPALPDGLTLDTATGTISGTPLETAGLTTYLITATNSGGTATATVAITVNVPELDTPTTTVNKKVKVSEKMIMVGGSSIMVASRDIQIEVTSKGTEKITHFYASEVSTAELQTIADKAVVTDGIDFTKAPPSIDSTTTPTLVVNTAVDITVNEDACRLANGGCEVTLSYEASDEQAGKDLYVFHYDGEKWEALPHVRRGTNTVTALADSFSPFALFNASGADKLAKQMQADNKQLQADNKQLNKDILPNLVQTMLASTMSAVSTRMDATFSGTPQGSYQLDGQTVKLNGSGNLQDAMANKLPRYAKSLKDGTMDWKAMLSRSSFVLPLNAVDGEGATAGGATVWGNSEYSLVSDKGWKGDVFSLQLGVDQRMKDDLLVGGLVSWSKGDVDYTQNNKSGDYTHQITSVHPYLAWSIDDVHLWSSAGYGQGELSKKDRNGNERRSDTHLLSLSAGVSGRLSQFGQSNLNLKSDMVLAQTNIDGSADNIPADSLASQRLRLLLEIDRELQLASGGRFHPLIEIGLRYDGGGYDAGVGNSGIGAVLGFGGRYANTGLTVEGKFHTLVGRKDYKEWGVQGTIRKTSANDQGLTFSLIPSYGATGNSANQVWKQKLSDGNKSNSDYQARLDVNVGYGLFTSGGLLTPYSELRMGKNNHYRLGLRWKPNSPFSLHLYGERKTSSGASDRILLETNIRF